LWAVLSLSRGPLGAPIVLRLTNSDPSRLVHARKLSRRYPRHEAPQQTRSGAPARRENRSGHDGAHGAEMVAAVVQRSEWSVIPDLSSYATRYDHVALTRDAEGILEMRLHSGDGPLIWGDGPHTELPYVFTDVGGDPENRVVILTGTGNRFLANLDDSWVGAMTPPKWDKIYSHGKRLLQRLLEIPVPVIAAINGPATVHAELAVLSDIVLAAEHTYFSDAPHFKFGAVPGDGVHVVWPLLLGYNRGRYFLLTGQRLDAKEAQSLGVVNEVLTAGALMDRAYEIARSLARQPDTTLRYARDAMTQRLKRLLLDDLAYGLALEGLGAYASWPTGESEQ
jgi:enoyl-CoA hydratase/carnithine racemase